MGTSRTARGMRTQKIVADDLRSSLWPWCVSTGSGRTGADLENTPGVSIEIKARRGLDIIGWLRQAAKRSGLAVLIFRPDGYGPKRLAEWPVVMRYDQWRQLMADAGYGSAGTRGMAEVDRR